MSDSEYTESLDAGQEEGEENASTAAFQKQELLYQQQTQNPYMQYAGSTTSSDGESSVSSTSSGESVGEQDSEDPWEQTKIIDEVLSLPRGLCENSAIFHEFFSLATWQDLPPSIQNHLQQFLPDFSQARLSPQLVAVEKARTLSMLFSGRLERFQRSPMVQFQRQLEAGNYRPDIRKLKDNILKSQRRERKFQHCERLSQMAKQLFLSRHSLLQHARKSLPDIITTAPPPPGTTVVTNSSKRQTKPLNLYRDNKLTAIRARKRFFSEISEVTQSLGIPDALVLSADEDDTDRVLDEDMKLELKEQQRYVEQETEAAAAKTNIPMAERCVYSTLFRKRSDCEEDETVFRFQQRNRQTRLSNGNFKEYLREHKRRKLTEPSLPEFETSDIRLRDVCGRAQIGGNLKRFIGTGKSQGRKPKSLSMPTSDVANCNLNSNKQIPTMSQQQQHPLSSLQVGLIEPGLQQRQHQQTLSTPSKLSEPPALVPIQTTIKKKDSNNQQITVTSMPPPSPNPHNEQKVQHNALEVNAFNKTSNNSHHNNTGDTLNISSFMPGHSDNLNLCIDDSSLLAGDHDAFNMLDSEVELQQEEVETFSGSNDDNNLTNFVIGNDIVLGSRNDESSHKNDLMQHMANTPLATHQMPKLKPIIRNNDLSSKQVSGKGSKVSGTNLSVGTNCGSELIQETHACFFSLIRDFFCSTPNHRMRYDNLQSKIDTWLRNPITALNEWYILAENWSSLLRSAINFLLGEFPGMSEDYVPYIEHKVQQNIYQWIGAGRDSDTRLVDLCCNWMEKRKLSCEQQQQRQHHDSNHVLLEKKLEVLPKSVVETDESLVENGSVLTPPAPTARCPTNWTVRAATKEETEEFQRQERERFEKPHRAYTYRMFGFESVVAPVKGIYTPMLALSKPRGHSMMVENRPNFVTILTLVRDATARLPNGEGTRADISELLKCSQYINQDAAENVLQTIVSGALDRMHTEQDPCVRYDPKRKIWIYLHRDRSEDDFEKIHQQNHTMGKTKKLPQQRKPKPVVMGVNTKLNSPEMETSASSGLTIEATNDSLVTLPALVPSNPTVVSTVPVARTQPSQHQIQTNKCPPVPPLKYNIPPNTQQQQQKSLLKSAVRTENKTNLQATNQINKQQQQFQIPLNKSNPATPIIVATAQGLQAVHVTNAATTGSTSQQIQQQSSYQTKVSTNFATNLAGNRVMLNKPIIINQLSNQQQKNVNSSTKIKTPHQILKQQQSRIHTLSPQQQQQMQQQLQPNVITIPISMPSNLSVNTSSEPKSANTIQAQQQQTQQQQQSPVQTPSVNRQNIIRIVPASNVKTVLNSSTGQQIVNRQRIVTTTKLSNVERPNTPQQQHLKSNNTNKSVTIGLKQQLISNNGNIVAVNTAGGATLSSATGGPIVKMTPQAFSALQQKQAVSAATQQQQPHIVVNQGVAPNPKIQTPQTATGIKPQRILLGNTAVMAQSLVPGKNIIFQQVPMSSSTSVVAATPTNTATTAAAATNTISSNKIQAITATNLTPQQQKILIQNLKQQQQQQQQSQSQTINKNQIQFKTVQVVSNTGAQHNVIQRSQAITVTPASTPGTSAAQTTFKPLVTVTPQEGGSVVQQTNLSRILKTTTQRKIETTANSLGNRVITNSSGQIISLDSLLQKQGGALRITGTGGSAGILKANVNKQINTTMLQKAPQQQQQAQHQQTKQQQHQQFAIVSVPNSIISLGNSNNLTVGQRIITTQAAGTIVNTTMVNVDGSKVTPTVGSTGQRRIVTTPAVNKIAAKTSVVTAGNSTASNIRVLNTVNQASGINLATLQGKQVVLTSGKTVTAIGKSQMASTQQQQSNILQTTGGSIVIGGQTIKLQQGNSNIQQFINKTGNIITPSSQATATSGQMQTVIMGNQILRVQQMPQIITAGSSNRLAPNKTANNSESTGTVVASNVPKTIFVGPSGQTLRFQPASTNITQTTNKNIIVNSNQQNVATFNTATNSTPTNAATSSTPNRVVLAVQGGGQIFLSPNIQGGNINLKSLQGLKMVSLAQTKDRQAVASSPTASSTVNNIKKNTSITASTASDGNL